MNEGAQTMSEGGSLFTLGALDLSPLTDTITSNAPMIIADGIGFILVKKAVPLIPALVNRLIK